MKATIVKDVGLAEPYNRSKYAHIYKQVMEHAERDTWLVLSDVGPIREASLIVKSLARFSNDYEIKLRKYDESGNLNARIFIRKR